MLLLNTEIGEGGFVSLTVTVTPNRSRTLTTVEPSFNMLAKVAENPSRTPGAIHGRQEARVSLGGDLMLTNNTASYDGGQSPTFR